MKVVLAIVCVLLAGGCGNRPTRIGILVNNIGLSKTRLGDAPADLPQRQFSAGSLQRSIQADVSGDDTPEVVVELAAGRGIEIRDQSGRRLAEITAPRYLTDFGTVPAAIDGKDALVLYMYPNERRGGTFMVITADRRELARWDEDPPPGRFAVASWSGRAALFFLQGDALVVRSPDGERVGRFDTPQGSHFRALYVGAIEGNRTVVVAAGDGYTPYHMVCVYDSGGRILFQDVAGEHAFGVEASPASSSFIVITRSAKWRYAI
jgi:hypothetical protein